MSTDGVVVLVVSFALIEASCSFTLFVRARLIVLV